MIYLKKYENIKDKPKIKNWAIARIGPSIFQYNPEFIKFIDNSIGYIWNKPSNNYFLIKYFNIPQNILKDFSYSDFSDGLNIGNSILVPIIDIIHYSPNKENLKHYITANKYNL
jgi:hypothetical protein